MTDQERRDWMQRLDQVPRSSPPRPFPRCLACVGCHWACPEAPCGDPGDENDGPLDPVTESCAKHMQRFCVPDPDAAVFAAMDAADAEVAARLEERVAEHRAARRYVRE